MHFAPIPFKVYGGFLPFALPSRTKRCMDVHFCVLFNWEKKKSAHFANSFKRMAWLRIPLAFQIGKGEEMHSFAVSLWGAVSHTRCSIFSEWSQLPKMIGVHTSPSFQRVAFRAFVPSAIFLQEEGKKGGDVDHLSLFRKGMG